jgi:uncharacterized protein YjbI with pentapeptide repeats
VFAEVKLDLAAFRSARFRRVEFRGCTPTRADFANADIGGVTFRDCDLAGASSRKLRRSVGGFATARSGASAA